MKNNNQQKPYEKGLHSIRGKRVNRIKEAAALSREHTPSEICRLLGISHRTLKRYAKDPSWRESGGVDMPRYFVKGGRPLSDPDTDKQLITEAYRLHAQGDKWKSIAEQLGLTIRQLEHLRTKYPV